jgi:aspartyl-tRNA(Asn)/glutamyl-tRNA(Gln) amidotransferase subunit C
MKISKQEVEHIANLARLELSDKEKEKFSKQLSEILDFVKKIQEVDLSKVEPTAQITGLLNVVRPDVVKKCEDEIMAHLIEMAPEKSDNLIKVKPVFENS